MQYKISRKYTMIYFGIILGIILFIAVSYMALNKKSDRKVRIVSIIALAFMILTLIICLIAALTDNRVPVDESVVIVGAPVQIQEVSSTNIVALTILIIILILVFLLIAYNAIKEKKTS